MIIIKVIMKLFDNLYLGNWDTKNVEYTRVGIVEYPENGQVVIGGWGGVGGVDENSIITKKFLKFITKLETKFDIVLVKL